MAEELQDQQQSVEVMEIFVEIIKKRLKAQIDAAVDEMKNIVDRAVQECKNVISDAKSNFEGLSNEIKKVSEEVQSIKTAAISEIKSAGSETKRDVETSQAELLRRLHKIEEERPIELKDFARVNLDPIKESILKLTDGLSDLTPQVLSVIRKQKNLLNGLQSLGQGNEVIEKKPELKK